MHWLSFFMFVQFNFAKNHFLEKSIFETRSLVKSCGVYWGKEYHVWLLFHQLNASKCSEMCLHTRKFYKNVFETSRYHSIRFGKSFRRIGFAKGNEIVKNEIKSYPPPNPTFWRFPLYILKIILDSHHFWTLKIGSESNPHFLKTKMRYPN